MYSYFTATNQGAAGSQNGLAILSRYPLQDQRSLSLPHCNLRFRSRTRMAQHAIVATAMGPVRVYNVHLDTRINPGTRLDQLRPILADAGDRQGPTIIGGDFNTNPLQWLGNVFPLPAFHNAAGQTLQFMQKQGYGSALPLGTTTHDLPGFQLDWVFVKGLKLGETQVQPLAISDHHAVRVQLTSHTAASAPLTKQVILRTMKAFYRLTKSLRAEPVDEKGRFTNEDAFFFRPKDSLPLPGFVANNGETLQAGTVFHFQRASTHTVLGNPEGQAVPFYTILANGRLWVVPKIDLDPAVEPICC